MVHEFVTPLTSMQMSSYLISASNSILPDELKEYFKIMDFGVFRLRRLIENISIFTQIEQDELTDEYFRVLSADIYVNERLGEIISECNFYYSNRVIFNPDKENKVVKMPRNFFDIIIRELLVNSLQHNNDNRKVYLDTTIIDDKVIISVTEEGNGVPVDIISSVKPFFKPNRNLNEHQGIGLGLYLIKSLCSRCNVLLSVNNNIKSSTSVQLSFKC
jgi:two-component system phosphate regulon sensor histidine kinase PhoR